LMLGFGFCLCAHKFIGFKITTNEQPSSGHKKPLFFF
jgi:hypothetical protein